MPQQTPKAKAFFKRSPAEWQLSDTNDNAGTGNWQMLTLTLSKGYASVYVDGVLDGTTKFYFPGKKTITGLSIGRGFGNNHGPNTTIDEATFAKVGRSSQWISASYQNQKPNSNYLNFGNLVGPISLNDPTALKSTERRILVYPIPSAFPELDPFQQRDFLLSSPLTPQPVRLRLNQCGRFAEFHRYCNRHYRWRCKRCCFQTV